MSGMATHTLASSLMADAASVQRYAIDGSLADAFEKPSSTLT